MARSRDPKQRQSTEQPKRPGEEEKAQQDSAGFVLFAPTKRPKKPAAVQTEAAESFAVNPAAVQPSSPSTASARQPEGSLVHQWAGLDPWQIGVLEALSIRQPTAVQTACIPAILAGRNVLATAPTGSGKTAAFALPLLKQLHSDPYGIFGLILTPTRELALQIAEQLAVLGRPIGLVLAVVLGGLDMMRQAAELARKPHIVVATPGRLADLLVSCPDCVDLSRLRAVVLDEADRLVDHQSTFVRQAELSAILAHVPPRVQTLLFTATATPDTRAFSRLGSDPFVFVGSESRGTTAALLRQQYCLVPSLVRDAYLVFFLQTGLAHHSIIVFVNKCRTCETVRRMLQRLNLAAVALHSHMTQRDRMQSLARFKSGSTSVLLSTDVGSRGLDLPSVQVVVNYDVPADARDYVHRIGRTARAGRAGLALTLVSELDVKLVHNIEAHTGTSLVEYTPRPAESAVLPLLHKVSDARRLAAMELSDTGFGRARQINKQKRDRQRIN